MLTRIRFLLAFLLSFYFADLAQGQIKIAPTIEALASYEDGVFLGLGVGIRKGPVELIPSYLLGEGKGGKLELRWYQKVPERSRLRPYLTLQQIVFRRINACVDNSCPFVFYQVLPGAGTGIRIGNHFQILSNVVCGIKFKQNDRLDTDFILGLGGRYEF